MEKFVSFEVQKVLGFVALGFEDLRQRSEESGLEQEELLSLGPEKHLRYLRACVDKVSH